MNDPELEIELPLPVSLNAYYKAWRNRVVVSPAGKAYKEEIFKIVFRNCYDIKLKVPLRVEVVVNNRDRRKSDLDNRMKCLLDGLTEACVWEDDSLIDELYIKRGEIVREGRVFVRIWRL